MCVLSFSLSLFLSFFWVCVGLSRSSLDVCTAPGAGQRLGSGWTDGRLKLKRKCPTERRMAATVIKVWGSNEGQHGKLVTGLTE